MIPFYHGVLADIKYMSSSSSRLHEPVSRTRFTASGIAEAAEKVFPSPRSQNIKRKGRTPTMETKPTHEQAQLHMQVYESRREARLRQARDWFFKNYFVDNFDDAMRIAAPGTEAGAFAMMSAEESSSRLQFRPVDTLTACRRLFSRSIRRRTAESSTLSK